MSKEKVVLAYSGGLDTSVCVKWLQDEKNLDVVCVCGNVGQEETGLDAKKQKALDLGVLDCQVLDLRDEFSDEFLTKAIAANSMYENKYPLLSALSRPLLAKKLVEVAHEFGATYVAHGCTGKGNDQVRFELGVKALAPQLAVIVPWREWNIRSREDAIDFAAAHNIPVPVTKDHDYSMDRNMWHLSHEGSDLEDPWNAPKDELFIVTSTPEKAPDKDEYVELEFEAGVPVAVNGEKLSPAALLEKLNEIGIRNGVGICDMVENRLVGMKSRGVYENPGGAIIVYAHKELERLCLDRATMHYKEMIAIKYAELVYDGMWFSPLREALAAFVDETQKTVTGTVRLKLYKGNIMSAGTKSPYSLYSKEYVTFGADEVYNQADATGFITLFGLPLTVRALMKQGKLK